MLFAFLVILADGLVTIPASQWKALDLQVPHDNTTLTCSYEIRSGSSRVQALLLERAQAERFHRGRSFRTLYMADADGSGRFRYRVENAGSYVLVLDNRLEGRFATEVALRIESNPSSLAEVRELSPERRRLVVTLSMLFLGAVIVVAAVLFLKHAT